MPRSKPTSNLVTIRSYQFWRDVTPNPTAYTLYDIRIKMVKFTNYLAPILEIESKLTNDVHTVCSMLRLALSVLLYIYYLYVQF